MRKLALALAPAAALAASLGVPLDQSMFVTLPAPAHTGVIGNPAIADVSVADQRHLIITGKGQGVTNLVVTDAAGRAIFDREIVVGGQSGDRNRPHRLRDGRGSGRGGDRREAQPPWR